jgi:lysophospholipase L1-like esterase
MLTIYSAAAVLIGLCASFWVQPEAAQPQPSIAVPETVTEPANPATIPTPVESVWWKERHEKICERARQGHETGDIGMLFVGDSITEQWAGPGREVWNRCYDKYNAVNMGIGGDRTQNVLWRLQSGNLEGLNKPEPEGSTPPKLVVLMIGTNNLDTDTPKQVAEGVGAVLATLKQKLPDTKVLLLGILPRRDRREIPPEKVARTNQLIAVHADGEGVQYLDIGDKFVSKDGTISKELMPDMLHLSPKGYELWAEAVQPKVKELMDKPDAAKVP